MKTFVRNSLLAFLLSFSFTNVKAQFVTIPDSNFVNWLNNNGYASCMNGNLMDTTCSHVVSDTAINCTSSGIADLTGIIYFDSLTYLNCENNLLTSLPVLPPSLRHLRCNNNQLTSLSALPSSLFYLYCQNNQLTSLSALPSSLIYLHCYGNQLTSLPALPSSLTVLYCYNNQLTALPALPSSLHSLWCSYNQLTSLPALPSSLSYLYCNNNQLTSLPALPSSLTSLHCHANQLTSLAALSSSLTNLVCYDNQLTWLPALPSSLTVLYCYNNQLTSLPALPSSLHSLWCSHNQLTSLPALNDTMKYIKIYNNPGLTCLPPVQRIFSFLWDSTGITCLPNAISIVAGGSANPPLTSLPVCDVVNDNNCPVGWNIKGNVFADTDTDCTPDTNEFLLGSLKLILLKNGTIVQQTFSNQWGQYAFKTDTGTYTYSVDSSIIPAVVSCPVQGFYTSVFSSTNLFYDDMDFALACKPGFDVAVVSIYRTGVFRPANYATVNVLAGDLSNQFNLHCASGISGTVTVVINGPATYSSVVSGALTPVVNGDTLVYSIADFGTVDFYHDFSFMVQTDTTAQANQQVCFEVTVTPLAGDNNLANNYYSHCFTVVNSYDPNIKEVSPTGLTDTSQYWLTYTVQFQNTGNAPAQHIYILDTLDNNIDESSIQLLAFSHEPMVQVTGNVVKFNLPNINLPDSVNDELNSHGYVQYKVKRNNNLSIGTQINNTAYIYFDFNAPVQTNTTTNQLAVLAGITSTQIQNATFSIFPNPMASGNVLNLFFNSPANQRATFSVYELSGRKVFTQPIVSSAQLQQINLPALAQGIYQCVVDYESGRAQQKLVIVKE